MVLNKEMMYRARIFSNGLHVMTVTTPERGQKFIKAIVHAPNFGLFGEKTQLAFMINRKIRPKIFDGHIMEIDFDIQDATQIGDLLDVCPEIVLELNPNYQKYVDAKKISETIDAQFTTVDHDQKENRVIDTLFEDAEQEKNKEGSKESDDDLDEDDERPVDNLIRNSKTALEIATTAFPYLPGIRDIKKADDSPEKIKKILELCNKSPAHKKYLYWIGDYLGVNNEIAWIVSQSRPIRVGIDPAYYKAQSGAAISEKVLSRPKEAEGWQTVVLILGIIGLVVVAIALILRGGI